MTVQEKNQFTINILGFQQRNWLLSPPSANKDVICCFWQLDATKGQQLTKMPLASHFVNNHCHKELHDYCRQYPQSPITLTPPHHPCKMLRALTTRPWSFSQYGGDEPTALSRFLWALFPHSFCSPQHCPLLKSPSLHFPSRKSPYWTMTAYAQSHSTSYWLFMAGVEDKTRAKSMAWNRYSRFFPYFLHTTRLIRRSFLFFDIH